jgi:DNA transformation protein and related proteins
MGVGAAFLQYILEQLERTGRVTSRRLFGGIGLYCDDVFFGLIDDDTLYFKVNDTTRADYETRGSKPFKPYADRPEVSMSYYTVPADILDDSEELVAWARRSVAIAAANPKAAKTQAGPSVKRKSRPASAPRARKKRARKQAR